jgi:formylglycine-generating enzyme required for sulfatase activity
MIKFLSVCLTTLAMTASASIHQARSAEKTFTNVIGMQFALIPKGSFEMGAVPLQRFLEYVADLTDDDEKLDTLSMFPPQRTVAIERDYYMGRHEVTLKQFREFVNETGYSTDAERDRQGGTGRLPGGQWSQAPWFTWSSCGFPLGYMTCMAMRSSGALISSRLCGHSKDVRRSKSNTRKVRTSMTCALSSHTGPRE